MLKFIKSCLPDLIAFAKSPYIPPDNAINPSDLFDNCSCDTRKLFPSSRFTYESVIKLLKLLKPTIFLHSKTALEKPLLESLLFISTSIPIIGLTPFLIADL